MRREPLERSLEASLTYRVQPNAVALGILKVGEKTSVAPDFGLFQQHPTACACNPVQDGI